MPRVKIDYIVSFSSEDPEHPASNLLLREVSKKKWLCRKGESTCSVVLQLPRSVKITGVHIGSHHAALVEVLVGRSETSTDQFQVLVPRSVFLSREESRRDEPALRVRSFGADALSAAREQRWDRVRLVCEQPHNKHCQFGLSFVHIDEAEGAGVAGRAGGGVPARLLTLAALESDEDDFQPGELFARHLQSAGAPPAASSDTGAQIRHATSQALKNIAESSTKLLKTPISKPPSAARAQPPPAPPARTDAVLGRHERHKQHDQDTNKHDHAHKINKTNLNTKESSQTKDDSNVKNKVKDEPKKTPKRNKSESPPRAQGNHDKPTSANKDKEVRKRRRSRSQDQAEQELLPGPPSAAPHTLLRGAALVLSGYENPRRAAVRSTALALGAQVLRDWGPAATHLICAFPNTPKLRAVRAAGGAVPVARADWLSDMSRRRRLLPWQWYATEPNRRVTPAPHLLTDPEPTGTGDQHSPDPDSDTDDEIEKVLQTQKKRRLTESKANDDVHKRDASPAASSSDAHKRDASPAASSGDAHKRDVSPAASSSDAHKRDASPAASSGDAHKRDASPAASCSDAEYEASTEEEAPEPPGAPWPLGGPLPDFFVDKTFAIDAEPAAARRMARYVRAYGGLLLEMSDVEGGSEVDYIVRGRARAPPACGPRTALVPAAWLASCHRARTLLPHTWRDDHI